MKTYEEFLDEMALNIGNSSFSQLTLKPEVQTSEYILSKDYQKIGTVSDGISIQSKVDADVVRIYTNDHRRKKTIHQATILTHSPNATFPYKHLEQKTVDTVKGANPKNHATNTIYNFWKSQKLPIRSSDMQFRLGHEMWGRLVDMALADGEFVYRHDGKNLHVITKQNRDSHVSSSFGTNSRHRNDHLILSHTTL